MGASGHGIELGANTPTTVTFRDITWSGYGADATTDAALYNNSAKAITVNIVGGTTPTVRNGTGASTTLVINPVTTTITVKDINSGSAIQNARVLVTAATGGNLPFDVTVTITRSASTATVTHTTHGLATGNKVQIKGATQQEYNGVYSITVSDVNTYTYTVSGTPDTPATGTIKSTAVIIDGLTNASGVASDTRSYTANQPIAGRVRKSSVSPLYKTSPISGTVSSTSGFSVTIQMIPDE